MTQDVQQAPAFFLIAGDPLAPHLTVMWACFMNGDLAGALGEFNAIAQDFDPSDAEIEARQGDIERAVAMAEEMEGWGG